MTKERLAREAIIQKLIAGYPSWAHSATQGHIDAFVDASAAFSLESLRKAQERFHSADGVPGKDAHSWPTAREFATQAKLFELHARRQGNSLVLLHNGLLEMDFGHGRVDLRGLTTDEQDRIIKLNGLAPDGRNLALMDLNEKRASLKALPAPDSPRLPVTPRLRTMK